MENPRKSDASQPAGSKRPLRSTTVGMATGCEFDPEEPSWDPEDETASGMKPEEVAGKGSSERKVVKGKMKPKYSKYMCYVPRNNQEIAIPTWELSKSQLNKLSRKYIIARDFDTDEMIQEIRGIMHPIVDSVVAGKGFSFLIPSKDKKQLEYEGKLCFPLLKCDKKCVTRSFYQKSCTRTATMTAWAFKAIFHNLKVGLVMTVRDLFYRRSLLFQKQGDSDGIIRDICLMLGCTRRSLNLISEEKGSVCGMMHIELRDGKFRDCSDGEQIPDVRNISRFTCAGYQEFDCIVVVEKGTIYEYLKNLLFHVKNRCLLVTANGMPDVATRKFLKRLQEDTNLPICGLTDPDPAGLGILTCYSQGSINLAHENFNLAVPSLIWVGISMKDIEECGIELHEFNSEPLSEKEVKTLENLLKDESTRLSPHWKGAVEKLLGVGRKASFEVLHEKGYNYVADELLPEKIRSAIGLEEANKNL